MPERCARGCCNSQAEHWRSVRPAIRALIEGNRRDAKLARDLQAYKSMVDQGLEPCRTEGAARLQDQPVDVIEGRIPWPSPQT